jgi:signal transduction histidine kinase
MTDKETNGNSASNLKVLLDHFLEISNLNLTGLDSNQEQLACAVLLPTQQANSNKSLRIAASRGLTLEGLDIELEDDQGLIRRTIETNHGNISKAVSTDPDLGQVGELRKCNSAYCVPLQENKTNLGVLLFAAQEEDYFAQPQRDFIDLVGKQVSISIQNFYHYQDIEFQLELHKEMRRKTARELHDGLTQVVAALAMRANFAGRMMEVDSDATAEELKKVEELARVTTKEIRQMIFALRPSEINSLGLKSAVESMASKMGNLFSLEVTLQFDQDVESSITMNRQMVIYSLIEEAVNIIRKNGGAEQIEVRLREIEDEFLLLEIVELGQGRSQSELDQLSGEAESMQATADLIKATVQVDTNQENGRCIRFFIPRSEVP